MDPISLAGAYEGLKAVKSLLGLAFNAKVDAEAKAKILEAQATLGNVQDTLFTLREKLAELQAERDNFRDQVAAERDWTERVAQYELSETHGGAVVFKFKGAPEHFACPSCFNKREVHILQCGNEYSGSYSCTGCNSNFPVAIPKPIRL